MGQIYISYLFESSVKVLKVSGLQIASIVGLGIQQLQNYPATVSSFTSAAVFFEFTQAMCCFSFRRKGMVHCYIISGLH
jgi:hypothetical protein